MLQSAVRAQRWADMLAARWLVGLVGIFHQYVLQGNGEGEDLPTDCRAEGGVDLLLTGALVRPL